LDPQSISSFVQSSAPIQTSAAKSTLGSFEPSSTCYSVNTDTLNVRSSACGSVSGTLPRNTIVTAGGSPASKSGCSLGTSIQWLQITAPVSGYVATTYLTSASCSVTPPPSTGGSLTADQLTRCMPGITSSRVSQYLPYLNSAMSSGGITTRVRQAAFLAQVGHESGSLRYMEEIASGAAYEGRTDLGNTQPGDGVKYKGRGPIQITGRNNYAAAGQYLGLDLINNPQQASTPQVGFRLATWFWNTHSLNTYADQNTQSSFDTITRRINGGTNGKADRDSRWRTCKAVLGVN